MSQDLFTLSRKIREDERRHPEATGAFSNLLEHIALAAKVISREVNKAGLVDILGMAGETNVQGEDVRKLDILSNDMLKQMLGHSGYVGGIASEEEEDFIEVPCRDGGCNYVVLFDPLDGSSNIDANVSVGTIFSILRKTSEGPGVSKADFLQAGHEQVAAGYVIYGSSTMLVYTTGNGVHGFTLDASLGEFLLSHPDIRTPERGAIFSVNMGNASKFSAGISNYIDYVTGVHNANGKPYTLRYIGSLVSDFHRNLLYGGIFLYPEDSGHLNGKLRLLYEANPLGMIIEQAGGAISTGRQNVLDVVPTDLHQRVPLIIGSPLDVADAEAFVRGKAQPAVDRAAAS